MLTLTLFTASVNANDSKPKYNLVGTMGVLKFVVIPVSKSIDVQFHKNLIDKLCPDSGTCFINFFTNSKNLPETFPLPDKILEEPTLMYKRSAKHQNEIMDWSCRLKLAIKSCF